MGGYKMSISNKLKIALKDLESKYIYSVDFEGNKTTEKFDTIDEKYHNIYSDCIVEYRKIFIVWHYQLNYLIDFMNYKRRYDKDQYVTIHYNAVQSRGLIKLLSEIDEIIKLSQGEFEISINEYYRNFIDFIRPQLVESGGSAISDYAVFTLLNYEPVFTIKSKTQYGDVMNIIFAAKGPKPDIIISDAIENRIEIVGNKEYSLIYDVHIENNNLTWDDLNNWWRRDNKTLLSKRLLEIYREDDIEKRFFNEYLIFCSSKDTLKYPALIPEVYLHYDPKTIKELDYLGKEKRLVHQRMDFLMLINGHRIVIELDGKQHYSEDDKPSPKKYADLVEYDRKMKLLGYDVYRFGGYEFTMTDVTIKIHKFFNQLISKYTPHLFDQ